MKKKSFRSQLFRKEIQVNDPEYWIKVYAELLFRIDELEMQKCNCFKCQTDLDRYLNFFQKLRDDKTYLYRSKLDSA
ncbi:MAG TPA: hypothetical protein VF870_08215 [Ignavibacteriaceae bacterium]